ncbi:hypothetical protein [Pseudoduganella violaceinigra]|uniref:hypothetical protein n=1 Tax=Pseudoduganella violaceinigra TaxID=246602 RepID=UPI000400B3CF|nr:hypothetical protein [Pseudoduganella violaceinigra]
MKKIIILGALCAAFSAHAAEATPQAALDQFLRFELDGGRLRNDTEGYFEQVHLVDGWKTDALNCDAARCKAVVTFNYTPTAGLDMEQAVPHPKGGSSQVEYTVLQKGGQWQVESGKDTPHVSRVAMEKLLKDGL